jgi:WD40 repeat protein
MKEEPMKRDARKTIHPLLAVVVVVVAVAMGIGGRVWLTRSTAGAAQERPRPAPLQIHAIGLPEAIQGETVTAVALGRGGLLAMGTANGRVRLVDRQLRPVPGREWTAKGFPVSKLAFSPDGSTLAGVTAQGALWIWHFSAGEFHVMKQRLTGTDDVAAIALSSDGRRLAAVGFNVSVFDGRSGKLTATFEQPVPSGGTGQYTAVAFTPDATAVVAVGLDQGGSETAQTDDGVEIQGKGGIHTWTLTGSATAPPARQSCQCPADGAAITGDGHLASFGTNDAHVVVWDARQRRPIGEQTISAKPGDHAYGTAVSADGKRVAAGTASGDLAFWDPAADRMLGRTRFSGEPITRVEMTDDGTLVLVEGQKADVLNAPVGASDRWLVTLG